MTQAQTQTTGDSLAIKGEMTIYTAAEQKITLVEALESTENLSLDLNEVTEIDSAGMQLLILMKKAALKEGKSFEFVAKSDAVSEVMELLNLSGFFGEAVVITNQKSS